MSEGEERRRCSVIAVILLRQPEGTGDGVTLAKSWTRCGHVQRVGAGFYVGGMYSFVGLVLV